MFTMRKKYTNNLFKTINSLSNFGYNGAISRNKRRDEFNYIVKKIICEIVMIFMLLYYFSMLNVITTK